MWKEYSKEKPTEEEHQYLVKEIVSNGTMEDLTFFHTCGYSKNLSKLDNFEFHGKTSGGFTILILNMGILLLTKLSLINCIGLT